MTKFRRTVAGEAVTINALPPSFAEPLWERWLAHVETNEAGVMGLDVETTAIDEVLGPFEPGMELRTVQFGSRRYAWVLDAHDPFWRPRIEGLLSRTWPGAPLGLRFVSHSNYDPLWCAREFGTAIDDRFIDTLVMAGLLYPGHERKDLTALTGRHLGPELAEAEAALLARFREMAPKLPIANGQLRKPTGKALKRWGFTNVPLTDEAFAVYAGLDAIGVRRLLDALAAMVKRAKGLAPLSRREQRIQRICTNVRIRGQRVDGEWARALLEDTEREYGAADARATERFGFSPRSPQVGPWLEARGAEFSARTKTGRPQITMPSASSEGTLPQLAERYTNDDEVLGPAFDDLLILARHKNLLTNLRIIVAAAANDGFVHPQINTQQAHHGRMSITKPAMQTFKKRDPRLRGCFVARDGWVLVGADYRGQENRIAAAYSRDKTLLRVVREDLSQHVVTAQMIFGTKYVDKSSVMNAITGQTFYDAAKTLDFAFAYGAGPARIGDQLGYPSHEITDEDGNVRRRAHPKAYQLWRAWREAYSGLVAWSEKLATKSMIVNPWGRRIPADPWRGYANGNYAISSTGREVLGDAIVALDDAGWAERIWCLLHDEIILEVPEDEAEDALIVLEKCMTSHIKDIPLPVDAKILGTRWGADKDE